MLYGIRCFGGRTNLNHGRLRPSLHRCLKSATTQTKSKDDIIVLGIESSCDDSCIGVVRYKDRSILADERTSQFNVHQAYGGIVPILAVREHEKNLPLALERAEAKLGEIIKSIDIIAVTTGPGLKACLRTGMNLALELSQELNVPVIGINHLEAHTLVPRLEYENIQFPYMSLLVSGGHTCLSVVHGPGSHVELGSTLDDAMGEAFDKVIRSLDDPEACSKHGGAVLESLAKRGQADPGLKLPVALRGPSQKRPRGFDFSFSGLKSATARAIARHTFKAEDVAFEFQRAAVQHAVLVVSDALDAHPSIRQLVVCGGVASNQYLRQRLTDTGLKRNVQVFFPRPNLCVDNGVMVAWCGAERWMNARDEDESRSLIISKQTNPKARWPLGDLGKNVSSPSVLSSHS